MKNSTLVRLVPALLSSLVMFFVAQPTTASAFGNRFHEAKNTDVVLEFTGWDTICLSHPEDRDASGFLPVLNRNTVAAEISRLNPGRNLAVVVVKNMTPEEQASVFEGWKSLLGKCGFHRVVFLHVSDGYSKKIDGLPIIQDLVIGNGQDDAKSVASNAKVSSAP